MIDEYRLDAIDPSESVCDAAHSGDATSSRNRHETFAPAVSESETGRRI